jgi:hypothetical protein
MLSARTFLAAAACAIAAFASGCAANRQPIQLPYPMPAMGQATTSAATPTAEIVTVTDTRVDRSLDMFLSERPDDFLRRAVAAELEAGGAFAHVTPKAATPSAAAVGIDLELKDLSWAVPNHEGIVKTAFWTSFLTGGLGGLAYGSTDTLVFGRAVIALKVTERAGGQVIFNETVDAMQEEKIAKLKCDTLETRSRVMAVALKKVLTKATQAVLKARASAATPNT